MQKDSFESNYLAGKDTMRYIGSSKLTKVYLCTHKESGIKRALKIVDLNLVEDKESFTQYIWRLMRLRHPTLINLLEFYVKEDKAYLVFDSFYPEDNSETTDLSKFVIKNRLKISESTAKSIIYQLGKAFIFLYQNNMPISNFSESSIKLLYSGSYFDLRLDFSSLECMLSPSSGSYSWYLSQVLYFMMTSTSLASLDSPMSLHLEGTFWGNKSQQLREFVYLGGKIQSPADMMKLQWVADADVRIK